MDRRLQQIPILHCRGTHRTVGFIIGRQFKSLISDLLKNWDFYNKFVLPHYSTVRGRDIYDNALQRCNQRFPKYVQELEGMAEGAEEPFYKLFLLHLESLLPDDPEMVGKTKMNTGCTSLLCNTDEALLGHTEDTDKEFLNNVYIVAAEILGEDEVTVEEKFTTLTYAGHLPGFTMGWNSAGLVHSINTLYPLKPYSGGTLRAFLTRAILKASNLESALEILRDAGAGVSDGFSMNLIYRNEVNGTMDFYNVEVAPPSFPGPDESQLSVLTVTEGNFYAHCNKYLRLPIAQLPNAHISSVHRHEAIDRYSVVSSVEDVKKVLSDVSCSEYPIYRTGKDPDKIVTVLIGVFDINRKTWSIYTNPPATSSPIAVLPMTFDRVL